MLLLVLIILLNFVLSKKRIRKYLKFLWFIKGKIDSFGGLNMVNDGSE